jgi:hypothetical protein
VDGRDKPGHDDAEAALLWAFVLCDSPAPAGGGISLGSRSIVAQLQRHVAILVRLRGNRLLSLLDKVWLKYSSVSR